MATSEPDRLASQNRPASDAPADSRRHGRNRRRVVLAWTWVACWAGVIWVLGGDHFSLAETSRVMSPWLEWLIGDISSADRYKIYLAIRKSAHFTEYGILAILTFRAALLAAPRNQLTTAGWFALFLVATLASADEARQAFSTSRSGSPYDVLIDITGGAIAIVGLILITRRMRPTSPAQASA